MKVKIFSLFISESALYPLNFPSTVRETLAGMLLNGKSSNEDDDLFFETALNSIMNDIRDIFYRFICTEAWQQYCSSCVLPTSPTIVVQSLNPSSSFFSLPSPKKSQQPVVVPEIVQVVTPETIPSIISPRKPMTLPLNDFAPQTITTVTPVEKPYAVTPRQVSQSPAIVALNDVEEKFTTIPTISSVQFSSPRNRQSTRHIMASNVPTVLVEDKPACITPRTIIVKNENVQ